jgi:hypothetical protein
MVQNRERDIAALRKIEQISSNSLQGIQNQNKSLELKLKQLDSEYVSL